jgi:uncharacterized protein
MFMKQNIKIIVNVFFLLIISLTSSTIYGKESVLESLLITTSKGTSVSYQIEIAKTPAQMMRGLMFRDNMPENQGMLFIYSPERPATMWMKNTIIPLDMLFIDGNGIVVNIARNTVPFSLDRISSGQAVKGVLELNAGQVDKHQISIGDTVTLPDLN